MLRYLFLSVFALLLLTACGGNDLDQLEQSGFKECVECDLSDADLRGANLYGADLTGANLTGADLTGATLTNADLFWADLGGVFGADFTGAINVP
jgi:uncharacterized protein YjbI with pentapeptide repeats